MWGPTEYVAHCVCVRLPPGPQADLPLLALITLIPRPLSCICSSLFPPSLTSTEICVAPASRLFSSISFNAEAGLWMTSPAAILLTTLGSSCLMTGKMVAPSILASCAVCGK